MRHISCKIYCPIVCFSKPSSHCYTQGGGGGGGGEGGKGSSGVTGGGPVPLELGSNISPQNPPVSPLSDASTLYDPEFSAASDDDEEEEKKADGIDQKTQELQTNGVCCDQNGHHSGAETENGLKSSLRKGSPDSELVEKKKVQWLDFIGKELVQVKEFDSSDTGDDDNGGVSSRSCLCSIL